MVKLDIGTSTYGPVLAKSRGFQSTPCKIRMLNRTNPTSQSTSTSHEDSGQNARLNLKSVVSGTLFGGGWTRHMISRVSKTLLVAASAFYYTLVVFNNLTDYNSNYQFVHHVLLMDSTFPGNHGMWRAIHPLWIQTAFYDLIILWEVVSMLLIWAGTVRLLRAIGTTATVFQRAKRLAIAGLTVGMLMWFGAFLTIGGEWFLMWQSPTWNGQEAAFRMFLVEGIILLLLLTPEVEDHERLP
jgi:predicted small integral membrane protein